MFGITSRRRWFVVLVSVWIAGLDMWLASDVSAQNYYREVGNVYECQAICNRVGASDCRYGEGHQNEYGQYVNLCQIIDPVEGRQNHWVPDTGYGTQAPAVPNYDGLSGSGGYGDLPSQGGCLFGQC